MAPRRRGGRHYPDLAVVLPSGHFDAIDVELSPKNRARRERILGGYARNDLDGRGCGQAAVRWAITSVFSSVHSTSPGRREATKPSSASASSASP